MLLKKKRCLNYYNSREEDSDCFDKEDSDEESYNGENDFK